MDLSVTLANTALANNRLQAMAASVRSYLAPAASRA
jgi:hypothetical protein